jgi:hypothetical protein
MIWTSIVCESTRFLTANISWYHQQEEFSGETYL